MIPTPPTVRHRPRPRSMKSHQPQASTETTWLTPRWILSPLGEFDLDPCTPESGMPWPTATRMLKPSDDGLATPWHGRVWLNPPFDKAGRAAFLGKLASHANGIALIPASTETDWFQQYIWQRASSLLFLDRRPHFCSAAGMPARANSGCAIVLAGFGTANDRALAASGLGVYLDSWRIPKQEQEDSLP
jgi:hypothetical protein